MKTNEEILDFLNIKKGETYTATNSDDNTSYFTVDIVNDEIVITNNYSNHIPLMKLFDMEYKLWDKPSLTNHERDLLKPLIDDDVQYIKKIYNIIFFKTFIYIIGENRELTVSYSNINFDGLLEDKKYTPEELGLKETTKDE